MKKFFESLLFLFFGAIFMSGCGQTARPENLVTVTDTHRVALLEPSDAVELPVGGKVKMQLPPAEGNYEIVISDESVAEFVSESFVSSPEAMMVYKFEATGNGMTQITITDVSSDGTVLQTYEYILFPVSVK